MVLGGKGRAGQGLDPLMKPIKSRPVSSVSNCINHDGKLLELSLSGNWLETLICNTSDRELADVVEMIVVAMGSMVAVKLFGLLIPYKEI